MLQHVGDGGVALGRVDEGLASCARRSISPASNDDIDGLGYAYSNLADMLSVAGRTRDAFADGHKRAVARPRGG